MIPRTTAASLLVLAVLLPVACGDDEETNGSSTAASTSQASSASAASSGATAGMGGGGATAGNGAAGGAGGQGGGSGGASGGYDGVACLMCIDPLVKAGEKCEDTYVACQGNADCNAWLGCSQACFQPAAQADCWDACDAAHAAGKAVIDAFYGCLCPDCAALCGTACN